jgi:hypothetical protein
MRPKTVLKKIYLKPVAGKRPVYEVLYPDGEKRQSSYIELQGASTLRYDKALGRFVIETTANISLGKDGACAVCGEDTRDRHVHA